MTAPVSPLAAQVARAQEILAERHTDGTRLDRETLALRIAALEQREADVVALVEASRYVFRQAMVAGDSAPIDRDCIQKLYVALHAIGEVE